MSECPLEKYPVSYTGCNLLWHIYYKRECVASFAGQKHDCPHVIEELKAQGRFYDIGMRRKTIASRPYLEPSMENAKKIVERFLNGEKFAI